MKKTLAAFRMDLKAAMERITRAEDYEGPQNMISATQRARYRTQN
ncbi:MAG: hypothetical protein R3B47_15450 [Bacteroidia bacterium]